MVRMNLYSSRKTFILCSIVIGLVITIITNPVLCNANPLVDLYSLYGIQVTNLGNNIEDSINELEKDINSIQQMVKKNVTDSSFDAIVDNSIAQYIDSVKRNLDTYRSNNQSIVEYMCNNVLTADIEDLLYYDTAYKSNVENISILREGLQKKFPSYYTTKYSDRDISKIQMEIDELSSIELDIMDIDVGQLPTKWILSGSKTLVDAPGYKYGDNFNNYNNRTIYDTYGHKLVKAPLSGAIKLDKVGDKYNVIIMPSNDIRLIMYNITDIEIVGNYIEQGTVIGWLNEATEFEMSLYIRGIPVNVDEIFKS